MKKNLLVSLALFVAVTIYFPVTAHADVLLTEHFGQSTETLATNENSFANEIATTGWTNINGSGQIYMSSTDLTYSGYKSETDATGSAEYKTTFGKKVATPLKSSVNSGSVYAAAIFKFSACSPASSPGRDYLWAFTPATSSISTSGNHFGRLCAQKSANTFQLGIAKNAESAAFISYTEELSYNTPYLIVMEYEFAEGTQNDVVRLYVNPSKGDKPAATIECKQYAENTSGTNVGSGTKADPSQFAAFMLYSTNTTRLACLIDELRITTSWEDLWEGGSTGSEPVIGVPEPEISDITINSATVSWAAVENADSYVLQWKMNGGSYSDDIEIDKDIRLYSLNSLESETKYYVRVKTIAGENTSDWATNDFTTLAEDATIVYKEITFDKYTSTSAMPTEGTVFLANNIVENDETVTLTGDLTINLHGKQLFMFGGKIIVPSGVTMTLYDDKGSGEITGGYPGSFLSRGLITIQEGGTLVISEGAVVNLDDEEEQTAIDNRGTLILSGAPTISGNITDIYLVLPTAITIEAGKPITNTTPYKVNKLSGSSFTSGWANMGGATPSDYFVSSNASAKGVCLNASGEAQIVAKLNFAESSNNSSIGTYEDQLVNVALTRSFVSSQLNTICLPFSLSDAQLQAVFGAGYDLEEFASSSFDGETIDLAFTQVNALVAGKPYLIKPAADVENPVLEGVTITAITPADQTDDDFISFHGVFSPTELQANNKNLLFLGANNELFWPSVTNNIPGFRAYFEVKGSAKKAVRARIVQKDNAATAIDNVQRDDVQCTKVLRNGQLHLLRNGEVYNVQGQRIK